MIKTDDQTINNFLKQVEEYRNSGARDRIHNDLDEYFYTWVANVEEFFSMASNYEVFSQPHEMEKDRQVASNVADTFNFALMAEVVILFGADKQDLVKFMKLINVAYSASYIRIISDLARNVEESKKREIDELRNAISGGKKRTPDNLSFGPSAGKSLQNRGDKNKSINKDINDN